MMNSHVLIIGECRMPHHNLKALGAKLTILINAERIKPEDLGFYDRLVGIPASASTEEWVELALSLHRLDPFSAIGGFHEPTQDKAAIIAKALGLRYYSLEVVENTRYKDKMRRVLQAADLDYTGNRRVETAAEIGAFAADYGYPVILKPVDGWASTGVSLIRQAEDIPVAIEWFRQSAPHSVMYLEQFLDGVEYSVETFSERGEHRLLSVTQKFKEHKHFVEVGHCLPAPINTATESIIWSLVSAALTALGVEDGGCHTEVMVTKEGPRIVETHVRVAGDFIALLVEYGVGINLLDLMARQVLGETVLHRIPDTRPAHSFASIWYVTPKAEGILERIEGEAIAREQPGVRQVGILHGPGDKLGGLQHSFSRAAYAIATGATPEEAVERAQNATNQLRFLVSCQG